MNKVTRLPIYEDVDMYEYVILSDKVVEGIFYKVSALTEFMDVNGAIKGTEINCDGVIYVTPLELEEVHQKFMFDEQAL